MDLLSTEQLSKYTDIAIEGALTYTPKIIGALVVVWIGFKIVGMLTGMVSKIMEKQKIDPMLKSFVSSLLGGILKVLVIISAAGMLGIQTSSFVAIIGAAGLAIGLALSGTLQNFASGVMILLFKPFKIGDFVETAGHAGTVNKIEIFNTIILTGDKKTIIIPNSEATGSSIINYSEQPKRRLDFTIGIDYGDDIDLAKATLKEIFEAETLALHDDGVTIGVSNLGDNSVDFAFRFFVNSSDYWEVYFRTLETVKKTFDKKGLNFPFPQQDVHMYTETV